MVLYTSGIVENLYTHQDHTFIGGDRVAGGVKNILELVSRFKVGSAVQIFTLLKALAFV